MYNLILIVTLICSLLPLVAAAILAWHVQRQWKQ